MRSEWSSEKSGVNDLDSYSIKIKENNVDEATIKHVKELIDYLTVNMEEIRSKHPDFLRTFEELTGRAVSSRSGSGSDVYRVVRSNGWTGTRYKTSEMDPPFLLQSLSNWYLRLHLPKEIENISVLFQKGDFLLLFIYLLFIFIILFYFICSRFESK
jgi:hypothetical protein